MYNKVRLRKFLGVNEVNKLIEKRLIFNVCIGRSGTTHMYKIVNKFRGISSFPERLLDIHSKLPTTPEMLSAESIMPDARHNKSIVNDYILKVLKFVIKTKEPVFYQTSFLISHGLIEGFIRLGIVPDFIFLKRSPSLIAKSHYSLGLIPGRTPEGIKWCLNPNQKNVWSIGDWDNYHDYQLCYWYALENIRRQKIYKEKLKTLGSKVFEIDISDLNESRGILKLINFFKLSSFDSFYSFCYWYFFIKGKKTNLKTKKKKESAYKQQLNFSELESEIDALFSNLKL